MLLNCFSYEILFYLVIRYVRLFFFCWSMFLDVVFEESVGLIMVVRYIICRDKNLSYFCFFISVVCLVFLLSLLFSVCVCIVSFIFRLLFCLGFIMYFGFIFWICCDGSGGGIF